MDKKVIIDSLSTAIEGLQTLRETLLADEDQEIRNPYWWDMPVHELKLDACGYAHRNRVLNACAKHLIFTIGQLVTIGRASFSKWPGIGAYSLGVISHELKSRFNISW